DPVGTLEQRSVADHAIVEQDFVARICVRAEILGILEAHVHRTHAENRPGNFRAEAERNSFHRLYLDHQLIGMLVLRRVAEEYERRLLKLDRDLSMALGEALARPQVERNPCPAPIVYVELEGHKSFR